MSKPTQTNEITLSKDYLKDMIKTAYRNGWMAHKKACNEISTIIPTRKYVWSKIELSINISEVEKL